MDRGTPLGGAALASIVICVLLLVAGDVESNPGPTAPRKVKQSTLDNPPTPKTPAPQENETVNIRDIIHEEFKKWSAQFMSEMDERFLSVNTSLSEIKETLAESNKRISDLEQKNDRLTAELESMKNRVQNHLIKIDDLEARSRRNNLVIHGLPRKTPKESWEDCEKLIVDMLEEKVGVTQAPIDRAHRLGGPTKSNAPIILRLSNFKDKQRILEKRGKLKGTDIFINEDFTSRVREIRNRLAPFMKRFRNEGKRVSMVYDHLNVDGNRMDYDWDSNTLKPARRGPDPRHQSGSSPPSQSSPI